MAFLSDFNQHMYKKSELDFAFARFPYIRFSLI